MSENILFIADGNQEIGFGHIARCLVLAEEFIKKGHSVTFLQNSKSRFSEDIKKRHPLEVVDEYSINNYDEIKDILEFNKISIVIIDLVESEYRKLSWLRERFKRVKIVTITLFLFHYKNRYEHISFFPDLETKIEKKCLGKYGFFQLYSGPRYFIFREEFQGLRKEIYKSGNKILITMGGSDPKRITLKVVSSLKDKKDISVKVVLSENSNCYNEVKKITDQLKRFELINRSSEISNLMLDSDIAIINGGSTRYEVCLAKTPFIAISIDERQFNITKSLTDLGVGINLGVYNEIEERKILEVTEELLSDYSMRKRMSMNSSELFDTHGSERIYNKIIEIAK